MEWISVKERLPEAPEQDWVLVACLFQPEGYYGVPHIAEYGNGKWYENGIGVTTDIEEKYGIEVTHWTVMPDNPELGKAD